MHTQTNSEGKVIQESFITEDAKKLSFLMNERISLGIDDNIQTCSKNQAEIILKRFFIKHKVEAFYFTKNTNANSIDGFYKAKLITENANYSVTVSLIQHSNDWLIHRLIINKKI